MDCDAALGIENEVVLDACQREIAAELAAVVEAAVLGERTSTTMIGSVDDAGLRSGELKDALNSAGVAIDEMERIAPSIEDLFVSLLTAEGDG